MKILHLISSSGFLGAERVLLEIAEYSKNKGLEVGIGVFQNSQNPNLELAEVAKREGFNVQIFPCHGRFDKKTILMIKNYVDKKGVRILHSHNHKSNFYAWRALSNHPVRWVVTNHGRRTGFKLMLYSLLNGFVVSHADRVIAVSKEIVSRMKRLGVDSKKICLIENGINFERFLKKPASNSIKESLGIKKEATLIGTIGALTKEKGHPYFLRAVPEVVDRYKEVVFLFVGDGKERDHLKKMAFELRIEEKVIFAGMRRDIPEILSILDMFVLPSLDEGLPMALLEAQAARVPSIATRVGAIPHVIEDGVTGVLIPPKDSQALAQAMIKILSDKKLASEIAQKGFERVRGHFSSEKMGEKYLSIYKELLEGSWCRA